MCHEHLTVKTFLRSVSSSISCMLIEVFKIYRWLGLVIITKSQDKELQYVAGDVKEL